MTSYLFYNSAPLGLLYMAAMLEEEGEDVLVIDAAAEELDIPRTVQRIAEYGPDLVGIGSTTVVFESSKKSSRQPSRTSGPTSQLYWVATT